MLCGYLSVACVLNAGVVRRDLHIVNAHLSPDGFNRSVVTAEGVFPAPLITGHMGDNFKVNVIDRLTDTSMRRATSIHWHGFFQAGTNDMDGGTFVNQCPIIPNKSFLYDFNAPNQAGTYWYHSHLSNQYCDGLRGPFVVYDPHDPLMNLYDIDDATTVITLADWYHQTSTTLFPNPNKAAPNPDSTLINGLGRYSGGPTSPLAVIPVTSGKRHRFRIISTSCFPSFNFSIDGHNLTIIEADGVAHQPLIVESLVIFPGQRYSVIVSADKPVGNYWIRAAPSTGNPSFAGGLNQAILRYGGAPVSDPETTQNIGVKLNEGDLVPYVNPGAPGNPTPGGADVNINLLIGRDAASHNFTMNGVAFVPPTVPVLLQILSGAVAPSSFMPSGSFISLPAWKVIEISIPGPGAHPFHLHGHNFDVVRVAGSSTYNFKNPVRRDVVNTGDAGDNVTFRFVTNNPGPWFLHCHIDWHLEAGLAIVFAEDQPDTGSYNQITKQWRNLCPLYNANNPDTKFIGGGSP